MTEIKILVFGSINIDEFFKVPHIVLNGETITSNSYFQRAGGKGANQAVALAKAGVKVWHAGKIGQDGIWIKENMSKQNVNVDNIIVSNQESTGRAFIQLSQDTGDNAIVLLPGTNHEFNIEEVKNILNQEFKKGDWLVLQNEIGIIGGEILKFSKNKGFIVVFNPAPLTKNILKIFSFDLVDYLIINKLEAIQLYKLLLTMETQIDDDANFESTDFTESIEDLLKILSKKFPSIIGIIITLGEEGLIAWYNPEKKIFILPSFKIKVCDTTGAGDTFIGYFVASIVRNQQQQEEKIIQNEDQIFLMALKEATVAAGLAVSKLGAMESIPHLTDVQKNLKSNI